MMASTRDIQETNKVLQQNFSTNKDPFGSRAPRSVRKKKRDGSNNFDAFTLDGHSTLQEPREQFLNFIIILESTRCTGTVQLLHRGVGTEFVGTIT